MGKIQKRFFELVDEFANGKHNVFAKKAGITPSTFQNYLNGRMPSSESLINICETYGVSATWILTGRGLKYIDVITEDSVEFSNLIEIQHCNLIKEFKDKERAKNINSNLISIEKLNPSALKELDIYIKGVANGLKIADNSTGGAQAGEASGPKNGTNHHK